MSKPRAAPRGTAAARFGAYSDLRGREFWRFLRIKNASHASKAKLDKQRTALRPISVLFGVLSDLRGRISVVFEVFPDLRE